MKKEDFINITDNMFDICEKLISNGGNCKEIYCEDCPFSKKNSTNDKPCNNNGYTTHTVLKQEKDDTLVQSARKFLDFRNNNEVTFHNAKVGDRVWDFSKSWGIIEKICDDDYPIVVLFENKEIETFTFEGKYSCSDLYPRLFWNEIKFEIPEKPFNLEDELRKLEIQDFFYRGRNFYLLWDNQAQEIFISSDDIFERPLCIYFNEKSAINFYEKIKDKKITKQQFFRAYKNVFGGR